MFLCNVAILLVSALAADTAAPSRAEIDRDFREQLTALADRCVEVGLPEQAELTRGWIISPRGEANILYLAPDEDPWKPADNDSQLVKFWYQKFRALRDAHADRLYRHAQELLIAHDAPQAYRTLHEILRNNPDHADARRILGYSLVGGTWRRPGVTVRTNQPRYAHPKFGWPARSFWQVDTPHFQIITDHSEAAGLELGQRLEIVYSAWEQMFFSFWSNQRQLAGYFDGGAPAPVRKKFEVVLFKDRGGYVGYLEKTEPRIGITQGIYRFNDEKVYLFHSNDDHAHATWHHEVAHQLFQEYRRTSDNIGGNFNAWAIEGVALYMESLRMHDGYVTLGGVDATRLQFSRNRRLVGEFYLPLQQLIPMSRTELQKNEQIGAIYSQSAGLAHFLLDGPGQPHREAFIDYLASLYQGNDNPHTLEQKTGTPLADLDAAYLAYLQVSDGRILALPEHGPTTDLALAHTNVTDAALVRIGTFEQLRWLDLANTAVTNLGVRQLAGCRNLRDLSLASTAIDDAALAALQGLGELEELDLSATRVTDQGLVKLRGLANLKILRLAVTGITDEGLRHLASLKQLQMLDLRRSSVTAAAIETLQRSLPEVEIYLETP